MKFCAHCGQERKSTEDKFCPYCAKPYPVAGGNPSLERSQMVDSQLDQSRHVSGGQYQADTIVFQGAGNGNSPALKTEEQQPNIHPVILSTDEPGVRISYFDESMGSFTGIGPTRKKDEGAELSLRLPRGRKYKFRLEKSGFEPLIEERPIGDYTDFEHFDYPPSKPVEVVVSPEPKPVPSTPTLKAGDQKTFDGIEFVYCPAGSFMMGSPKNEEDREDDELQHKVEISQGFWMGKVPVTQGQWEEVVGEWPEDEPSDDVGKGVNYPAYNTSWEDSQEFIAVLNSRSGNSHYRLPTEAEWEYACRATSTGAYCGGNFDGQLRAHGWFDENSGYKTHPVGKKVANAWGLHDMHGNVWEWCEDWYGDYSSGSQTDPTGPANGSGRVIRGGGWSNNARHCRSAYRSGGSPGKRYDDLGFRLLRTP